MANDSDGNTHNDTHTQTLQKCSVFEQIDDVDGAVHWAREASAKAPSPVQPVHTRDRCRVATDAQSLNQLTILSNLQGPEVSQ